MKKTITSLILTIVMASCFTMGAFAEGAPIVSEADFPGAVITYNEQGAMIVDYVDAVPLDIDPRRAITATTVTSTWAYEDSKMNRPLFIIPAGRAVTVLDTNTNYGSTKISYAGYECWVQSSNLRLGD